MVAVLTVDDYNADTIADSNNYMPIYTVCTEKRRAFIDRDVFKTVRHCRSRRVS